MKIVYIAHPIAGDVEANLADIRRIVAHINRTMPRIIPFVPYYADVVSLNDDDPKDRKRGLANCLEIIRQGLMIDEIWLTGDRVSEGMKAECTAAHRLKIPVKDFINKI